MRRVLCFLILAILVMGAKKSSSATVAKQNNPYGSSYGTTTAMNTNAENTYTAAKASKESKKSKGKTTTAVTTAPAAIDSTAISNLTKNPELLKTLATLRSLQEKDPKMLEALRGAGAALNAKNAVAAKGK